MHKSNRSFLAVAAPIVALTLCVGAVRAETWYVARSGDNGAGTNWATAKRTIQAAVNLATNGGDIVLVTNGTYQLGGTNAPGYGLINRVYVARPIEVRSVNGPAVTFIQGSGEGFGDDAVRGVYLANGASLSGFTIAGGRTRTTHPEYMYDDIYGGGIWMDGNCVASNCVLTNNGAYEDGLGGGAFLNNGGTLNNCTLAGNFGGWWGGGVMLNFGGTLNNCVIRGNTGNWGAGVATYYGGTLNNCLLTGNSTPYDGGAIMLYGSGTMNNCTLSGNTARKGGGAYLDAGGGTINNCVLWGNSAWNSGPDIYGGLTVRNSCAGNGVTHDENGNITNNPLFFNALAGDYRLPPESPCIDAGNNAYAKLCDLAGNPRIVNDIVDMGAYELQPLPVFVLLGTNGATIARDEAASAGKGTDFGLNMQSSSLTNTFAISNSGHSTLVITNWTTNGAAAAFTISDLRFEIPAGGVSNFTVTYNATEPGDHAVTLVIDSEFPVAPFPVNLAGRCYALSTNNGPYAGGNTIAITNGNFGNITNVLVGGVQATIQESGANWVRIVLPPAISAGVKDIVIQTSDNGDSTLAGAYTYNLPGAIDGIMPAYGSYMGGYPVTISGTNLCDGTLADVTNVTICGATATVQSVAGSTQVVVTAGAASAPVFGHVRFYSASHGETVKTDAFTYVAPGMTVLGTNGAAIANDEAASGEKGTSFGELLCGEALTNILTITNSGVVTLNVSGCTINGAGADSFRVQGLPASVAAGAVSNFSVVFCPKAGMSLAAALSFANDSTQTSYVVNLAGYGIVRTAEVYLVNLTHTYDGSPKPATATTIPAGLTVRLTYDTLGPAANKGANTNPPVNAGTYTVYGDVMDLPYQGSTSAPLTIAKATQTITFPAIPDQTETSVVTLAAAASSGLPVQFAIVSGPAEILTPPIMIFTGTGAVTVAAAQSGDANWNAAAPVANTFNVSWAIAPIAGIVDADFDGDRLSDPSVYDSSTGTWKTMLSGSGYYLLTAPNLLGSPGYRAAVGDYDGDRISDPAVYQEVTGNWIILESSRGYARLELNALLGGPGWAPASANYVGSDIMEFGAFQESTGNWKVKLGSNTGAVEIDLYNFLGGPGYSAVSADFDGDGYADPAVYCRADGAWELMLSGSGYLPLRLTYCLGGAGWDAVPGDYDGDGLADPAIRKADGAEWRIMLSGSGYALITVPFGL